MPNKINFTKAAIDALPIPGAGSRSEYCDIKQAGLRLRITSTGVKTFCVLKRIRDAGMERFTLARYPSMTIEQARKKTAEMLGKIAEGNNPAEARRAIKAEPTFAELFIEFGKRDGSKKRTWSDDKQRYRDYLDNPLGKHKVGAITSPMISRVLSEMDRSGKANATINNVRALASIIFSKGIEYGLATSNPVSAIKLRKKVNRDRFLQSYELPRFFASLSEESNLTIRDYFLISLLTGARRSNVLAMRWDEINLDEAVWRISRTKNNDPQNVTLGAEAIAVLKERKSNTTLNSSFVFPGNGVKGHLAEPKKGWRRILDRDELAQLIEIIEAAGGRFMPLMDAKAGIDRYEPMQDKLARARTAAQDLKLNIEGIRITDLRIHDLRRTLGSWQAKTGASLVIIGKSLNHKSHQATAIYARLDLDPVRESVGKATSAMLKAAGMTSLTPKVN